MANLRILDLAAVDIRRIRAKFTDRLDPLIGIGNVTVESLVSGVPDAEVVRVRIDEDRITIDVRPLTPQAIYLVRFQATDAQPFRNVNGNSFVLEDGQTNVRQITGPEEPTNPIRDNLISLLSRNIYNLNRGTFVRTIIDQLAANMLKTRNDIRQAKNDNYLNVLIEDERHVRGKGPFDRLFEEGAFQVLRVGKRATGTGTSTSFSFDSFPFDLITLLRVDVTDENLAPAATQAPGTHDRFLLLNLKNKPVTKLVSVTIEYSDNSTFEYDIRSLGYQIKDSKYDTQFGSTLVTLNENQIRLNSEVLDNPNFVIPVTGDNVLVSYEYKNLGRTIDDDSVQVTQVLDAVREPTPALTNEFTLKNAPIVTAGDAIASINGVQFLDPNSATPFLTTHPAFTKEVPFKFEGLPASPGEFAVDYNTGRVFVFGATDDNEGTGNFPPAATYKYRNSFRRDLDYTFNPITSDLVASPLRELTDQQAKISFSFEENLVPGEDFIAQVHSEVINERIQNRLLTTNSLRTLNTPITNAFRVFNETSGEIYQISRFNNNTIFFNFNNRPRILAADRERASFANVLNENLIVTKELTNTSGVRVFQINLLNNRIMSITEDVVGSSYNSSVSFSRSGIFQNEIFYDGQVLDVDTNINRLVIGQYQVDYRNGIVYVGVESDQTLDVGTINYKKAVIEPRNPHIISVSDIFHSINQNIGPNKRLNYSSFEDGAIFPNVFDFSDERFLNGDPTLQYIIQSNTITVTDDIKSVRHIFDVFDLNNNAFPTDFAEGATASGNVITLDTDGVEKRETLTVGAGLTLTVSSIAPGIVLNNAISAVRVSDNKELLDGYETVSGNTITLAASSGAIVGDVVDVLYTVVLTSAATPVVDYDRGGYFINYTYLADEILISYEHGDNVLDFRESSALNEGDEYFVTYRAGALRNALLNNFGSLVDLPSLRSFDVALSREIYRDALIAALQSFTKGPTIPALKQIASEITKIEPELIESIFEIWSLGISRLFLNPMKVNGDPQLVSGKFDQGLLTRTLGESVSFPVSSNLRLEEGTLEMWVRPEWDGLDNDATLTFIGLVKDGYTIASTQVFIGASSFNPTFDDDGNFAVNRADDPSPAGLPSAIFTKTGVFIFYDEDVKRWKFLVKDAPVDGYSINKYSGTITSSGEVYDVKFIENLGEPGDVLRSGINKIDFEFNIDGYDKKSPDGYSTVDGYITGFSFDGITFMADDLHYFFDFAENDDKNRFSLFKDGRGYLNFNVWDRGGRFQQKKSRRNKYEVSADIQSWEAGEFHHIACAWKLNTSDRRDEMHLFVDGFEVPNILRYGGRPIGTSSDRFRTVKPEIVVSTIPKTIIVGNDLNTTQGSATVVSDSVDFGAQGIVPGDTIKINEQGFDTFTILSVLGDTLVLDTAMPATLTDARFSVNPFSVIVSSQIDLYANIAVSLLSGGQETELPGLRADLPGYEISKNALNENVLTILGNAAVGDQILIRTLGLNFRRCRERVFIWGDTQSVLKTNLPPPINLDEASIRAVPLPFTVIGPNNAALVGGNFVATGLSATQPTNLTEGRQLEIRVTGGNVDFSTPTEVTINGTTAGGPLFETVTFSAAGSKITTQKFKTITSVDVTTTPIVTSRDGTGVEIKEAFSVTTPNGNNTYPVLRFAFKTQTGKSLEGDGGVIVSDPNGFFPESDVGNLLVINSPAPVAGTFDIEDRVNNTTIRIDPAPGTAFTDGRYDIFNVSIGRSGFQNGFFFLEEAGSANTPFTLPEGFYDFDYTTFLDVPFDSITQEAFVGSDFNGQKQSKAVIDELRISSTMLTDTRVGETLPLNEESITTSFQALQPFRKKNTTLVLLHFDDLLPLENDADYYIFANREFVQSGSSVNAEFNQSILITDKGLSFDNDGRLDTRSEGSIEFWVSPRFDTYNDPNPRFYFDASSSVVEEVTSLTRGTVLVTRNVNEVQSIRLQTDIQNTGTEFFGNGTIANDRRTLLLQKPLPFQQTPVKVAYVPSGITGDRISIFKDSEGFITLNVRAQGQDFQVRQPVFWARDSWHRVRATFKLNRTDNNDEIRLFVDGEERGVILFGSGLLFGEGIIFGQTTVGVTNQILITDINFTDPINQFHIGSDFLGENTAQARIDNLRLSNISRDPIVVAEQPIDVNFSNNLDIVFPVIEDAFTTFLLDFNRLIEKTDDFAILRDERFGIFNFRMNIIDSFRIVSDNARVQQLLEEMILALKPANSKAEINIVR